MNSGRAASAALSRNIKQQLIRLLFVRGKENRIQKAKDLDYSHYTYSELRKAYLQRAQEIHPDKSYAGRTNDNSSSSNSSFVELKSAWDQYENLARMMNLKQEDAGDACFTMFAVGCSFADSEEERVMRNEIVEQACRGWFSSGSLSADSSKNEDPVRKKYTRVSHVSLLDESMFVSTGEESSSTDIKGNDVAKPCLVSFRGSRRKRNL